MQELFKARIPRRAIGAQFLLDSSIKVMYTIRCGGCRESLRAQRLLHLWAPKGGCCAAGPSTVADIPSSTWLKLNGNRPALEQPERMLRAVKAASRARRYRRTKCSLFNVYPRVGKIQVSRKTNVENRFFFRGHRAIIFKSSAQYSSIASLSDHRQALWFLISYVPRSPEPCCRQKLPAHSPRAEAKNSVLKMLKLSCTDSSLSRVFRSCVVRCLL